MTLSPGKWHEQVPRELRANLRFRRKLNRLCLESAAHRRAVIAACEQDCLFWINAFVWQFNPNAIGAGSLETGPFLTWPFQDRAVRKVLDCIERRRDLVIEKSREMGASWLCLLIMDWLFLFHPWKKFLAISRNEHAVDRPGDPDCLFWKLDYVHDRLPSWMNKPRVERRKMGFSNPTNGSTITGQASTGKAGVGGRATAMFIDEFSQIDEDYEVLHRTSDTTGCRIFNGTHTGTHTCFYELTDKNSAAGSYIESLQMHWTEHPDKIKGLYRSEMKQGRPDVIDTSYHFPEDFNFVLDGSPSGGPFPGLRSPWYDDQVRRKGSPRAAAMDLDINPEGTVSQFFDPLRLREIEAETVRPPYWEGELDYDREAGRPVGLVQRNGGLLKLWTNPNARGQIPGAGPYGAGADVSTGQGATPSCLSIANSHGEKIIEYAHARMLPHEFAAFCVALCRLLGDCRLCWECAGPGGAFGNKVIELGYYNVYMRKDETNAMKRMYVSDSPGWYPSNQNKLLELESYRAALYGRKFINRSKSALEECRRFMYTKQNNVVHSGEVNANDPTGAALNHGDQTIADALAWKMVRDGAKPLAVKIAEAVPPNSVAGRRAAREEAERRERAWA